MDFIRGLKLGKVLSYIQKVKIYFIQRFFIYLFIFFFFGGGGLFSDILSNTGTAMPHNPYKNHITIASESQKKPASDKDRKYAQIRQ